VPVEIRDLREIAALRLRNQRVTGEKLGAAADVVAWLGCVQAQEYPVAKWTIGMRTWPRLHDADVDQALARGEILRTHILRPTWHFVTPNDIRSFLRLTGPRIISGSGARRRFLGLDETQINASLDVIARALEGGNHMTRLELIKALNDAGLNTDGQRMVYIGMSAELSGLMASGVPRGRQQTFALLDEWAPPTARDKQPFDREAAANDLVLRFFTSHGPATFGDFVWWSGLTIGDAKRGIAASGGALEELDVAGERFWWAGDRGGSADSPPSPQVFLMQAYDEYVVAYRAPRTPINLAGLTSDNVLQRPPYSHTVVIDTQIAGFWRRSSAGDGYRVDVNLLRTLTSQETAALQAETERYAQFVQRPVSLGYR
jgi:hypothetical protein